MARAERALRAGALALALLAGVAAGAPRAAAESIRRAESLAVEGAELYLLTRGADRRAPILLWLHGGPGGAERPLFRLYNGDLEDDFVVAYLDQRGAGRSFDAGADPKQLTVARHLADLDAVVEHLRRELRRDRVILAGHSWGGALGLLYAREHADKVAAMIAVSPVVSTRLMQQAQYEHLRAAAARAADEKALEVLHEVGVPPHESADEVLRVERIAEQYGSVFHRPPNRFWIVARALFGGFVMPWEIRRILRGNRVSLEAMNRELVDLDLFRSVPALDVPVVFLLGRHDRHVSAEVASRYVEALRAPVKKLVWFEESAHNAPFEEPDKFDATVASEMRALGLLGEARTGDRR